MSIKTYLRSSAGTFFTSGDAFRGQGQPVPPVSIRQTSEQATTVGVHVKGNLKVQAGTGANSVSVMLDPVALRRKMAIEQLNRDVQGINSSTTIKR